MRTNEKGGDLTTLTYAYGKFWVDVQTQSGTTRIRSDDGITWQIISTISMGRFQAVATARGRWVAVLEERLAVSDDGVEFKAGALLPFANNDNVDVLCGDTEAGFRFLVVSPGPLFGTHRTVAITSDGLTWLQPQPQIYESEEWEPSSGPSVIYSGGNFFRDTKEDLAISHDGESWRRLPSPKGLERRRLLSSSEQLYLFGYTRSGGSWADYAYRLVDNEKWENVPELADQWVSWIERNKVLAWVGRDLFFTSNLKLWHPAVLPLSSRNEELLRIKQHRFLKVVCRPE